MCKTIYYNLTLLNCIKRIKFIRTSLKLVTSISFHSSRIIERNLLIFLIYYFLLILLFMYPIYLQRLSIISIHSKCSESLYRRL